MNLDLKLMRSHEAIGYFGLAIFFLVLISLPTLTTWPALWQDEMQIVDFGRVVFDDADKSWSINWIGAEKARVPFSFFGAAYYEAAFRLGGVHGVRLASLSGGVFAGLVLLIWLTMRGVLPVVALVASLVFVFDPIISQSYRGARLDLLAMGFIFCALALLRLAAMQPCRYGRRSVLTVLAGAFIGLAGLTWPSAALLLPLVIYEIFSMRQDSWLSDLKMGVLDVVSVAVAAASCMLVLALMFQGWDAFSGLGGTVEFGRQQASSGFQVFMQNIYYFPTLFCVAL